MPLSRADGSGLGWVGCWQTNSRNKSQNTHTAPSACFRPSMSAPHPLRGTVFHVISFFFFYRGGGEGGGGRGGGSGSVLANQTAAAKLKTQTARTGYLRSPIMPPYVGMFFRPFQLFHYGGRGRTGFGYGVVG